LRCAADDYDRAARAPHRQVPYQTQAGDGLRTAARLLALTRGDGHDELGSLARSLLALVDAVAGLRTAQAHAAQAAAARQTTEQLHAALPQARQHNWLASALRSESADVSSRARVVKPPTRVGPAR